MERQAGIARGDAKCPQKVQLVVHLMLWLGAVCRCCLRQEEASMLCIVTKSAWNPRKPCDGCTTRRKIHTNGKIKAAFPKAACHAQHPEYSLVTAFFIIDEHIVKIGVHPCNAFCQRYRQHRDTGVRKSFMQSSYSRYGEDDIPNERKVNDQYILIQGAPPYAAASHDEVLPRSFLLPHPP